MILHGRCVTGRHAVRNFCFRIEPPVPANCDCEAQTPLHAGCSGITPILPHFHDRSCQSRCIIGKHIRAIWRTPSSLPRCASNERRFPYTPRNNLYRLCQPHHYSTRLACLASRYTVTLSTHATLSSVSKHRGNCHNCG